MGDNKIAFSLTSALDCLVSWMIPEDRASAIRHALYINYCIARKNQTELRSAIRDFLVDFDQTTLVPMAVFRGSLFRDINPVYELLVEAVESEQTFVFGSS